MLPQQGPGLKQESSVPPGAAGPPGSLQNQPEIQSGLTGAASSPTGWQKGCHKMGFWGRRAEMSKLLFRQRTVGKHNFLFFFLVSRPEFGSLPSSNAYLFSPETVNQMLNPQIMRRVVLVNETEVATGTLLLTGGFRRPDGWHCMRAWGCSSLPQALFCVTGS